MRKTTALKRLIRGSNLSFLMEAHNALSAKLVEEAGFDGIWASGLCLSASMGVRDNNELSWTQVLDILEFMSDATSVPILLDGDTGYGNFNNVQRLVRKLEQNGIAGVCIEDKLFPKMNSFIRGESQELAGIDEFCGKIKAGKDAQSDVDFVIVARTEALIAGLGLSVALKRAEAYRKAGADAILIHSKKNTPHEILDFAAEWGARSPLIIVPTTYYSTPVSVFQKHKVSTVIWANHLLRASAAAMRQTCQEVMRTRSVADLEDRILPVKELFRLQGVDDLLKAEEKYAGEPVIPSCVILAASRGKELGELTAEKPKSMISILGKPILQRLVEDLRSFGVRDITVVAGYKPEKVAVAGVRIISNPRHEKSRDLASLAISAKQLKGNCILAYGDLLVRRYVLSDLIAVDGPLTMVVDSRIEEKLAAGIKGDYVACGKPDGGVFSNEATLTGFIKNPASRRPDGQWIGLLKADAEGCSWIRNALQVLKKRGNFDSLSVTDLLDYLVSKKLPVRVQYISGHWLDVNHLPDLEKAQEFAKGLLA